jgi:hypothetical protein
LESIVKRGLKSVRLEWDDRREFLWKQSATEQNQQQWQGKLDGWIVERGMMIVIANEDRAI